MCLFSVYEVACHSSCGARRQCVRIRSLLQPWVPGVKSSLSVLEARVFALLGLLVFLYLNTWRFLRLSCWLLSLCCLQLTYFPLSPLLCFSPALLHVFFYLSWLLICSFPSFSFEDYDSRCLTLYYHRKFLENSKNLPNVVERWIF